MSLTSPRGLAPKAACRSAENVSCEEVNAGRRKYDVAVVGGGLIGLATASALLRERPRLRVVVLEKEREVAQHQSGRNSGVMHAGLYYAPESLKARLCREGLAALTQFADEHDVPYEICGKLVVALERAELPRLDELERRGRANGIHGLRRLCGDEMREREPHVAGVEALLVPETGIVDFRRVARAYAAEVENYGADLLLGARVVAIEPRSRSAAVRLHDGREIAAGCVVTCAGLHSDRIAALTRDRANADRIVPFRGDYYTFVPPARELVRGLIYPVPDPAFPFLGVHFTRRIDGEVWAGPNAVPAFAREGYRRWHVQPRDLFETLRFPGFRRLARTYARTGAAELWRDLVKPAFVAEMRRYVPALESRDVRFGPSGVRAQCLSVDGRLIEDFVFEEGERVLHVLNAPSPGATASLAIGRLVAGRALRRFLPAQ
jgi:(S)-2-hydroxyglutarate dehydrogenase